MVTTVNTQGLAGRLLRPAEWADTGNKSQPTAEDPQAVVVKISPEGARQAEAVTQAAAPSTQQLQAGPEAGGNLAVAPQQSRAAAPETPEAPPAAANGGARPAAPAGGQAPAAGAGGGSAAVSTGSTSRTYPPADIDQDGAVSPMEETAYEAKLAAEKQAKAAASAPRAAEIDAAVKTYESVEQLGGAAG